MTPRTPRQEELLDLALDLAREVGLAGLTVRRLSERAGFTEAALYRHFPSKGALLVALMGRIESRFLPAVRRIAEDEERPVAERLAEVVGVHLRAVLAVDGLPMLLLGEAAASGDEALQERMRATVRGYTEVLEGLLARLPLTLAPREASLLLLGLSAASAIRHRLLPDSALAPDAVERLPGAVVELLVGGRRSDDSRE
ncbi:MAG TPA: TetR family transcriptional regulator [Thermoanaerobaculia bacterium]